MNPIDSSKKWILNKLIPLIERQDKTKAREEDLLKSEGNPNPIHSVTSKQDENEQYSDLLEDSEYPKK
tara:strand:+ start:781 stop:984 length:204 start_codon:yes stop_codon:yes gene_type:complete